MITMAFFAGSRGKVICVGFGASKAFAGTVRGRIGEASDDESCLGGLVLFRSGLGTCGALGGLLDGDLRGCRGGVPLALPNVWDAPRLGPTSAVARPASWACCLLFLR